MRLGLLVSVLIAISILPAQGQSILSPLNPPGWSDLRVAGGHVGYWINGQRLCDIQYDPVALEAQIQQTAMIYEVSVAAIKREAQLRADEFAPHVTSTTCHQAREQAKRLGILSGYKPPREFPPAPESLSN
ncbi:hypothetical protein FF80_03977 [Devosia sp. LC5]|uniref:hypothetical protein n=1 Tax=Devosia sp. LC5 TaxID=1502724 RepID=UPI0004E402C5|nr:hypothetical protein [Devosia sp. LC5]KFC61780.1 hypothetical protein FF80_03977 [Devosia sp. LC5]